MSDSICISRPPSRNTARRGRFPSRLNVARSPYPRSPHSEQLYTETENTIPDSQENATFRKSFGKFLSFNGVYDPTSALQTSEEPSPHKGKSMKNSSTTSSHLTRMAAMANIVSAQKYQMSGNFQKCILPTRKLPSHIQKTRRYEADFDKQFLNILTERNRDDDEAALVLDDVIPATPERTIEKFPNGINRKTFSGAHIKTRKPTDSLNNTQSKLNETVSNNDAQRIHEICNVVSDLEKRETNIDELSNNMPRGHRNTSKLSLSRQSKERFKKPNKVVSHSNQRLAQTGKEISKGKQIPEESNIPKRLKTSRVDNQPLAQPTLKIKSILTSKDTTKNINAHERLDERENAAESRNNSKVTFGNVSENKSSNKSDVNLEEETQQQHHKISVKIIKPKKNKLKRKVTQKCKEKLSEEIPTQVVIEESQSHSSCEKETGSNAICESHETNELNHAKGDTTNNKKKTGSNAICESHETNELNHAKGDTTNNKKVPNKQSKVNINKRKERPVEEAKPDETKSLPKTRKRTLPKRFTTSEEEITKSSIVKRRRKILAKPIPSDHEDISDNVSQKIQQPAEKSKGSNNNYAEKEDIQCSPRKQRSNISIASAFRMCTRSQSSHSLTSKPSRISLQNSQDASITDKLVDEFFERNCTMNDPHLDINPETIRRLNASSSEESGDEENNATDKIDKIPNQKKNIEKDGKVLQITIDRSPLIDRMLTNNNLCASNKMEDTSITRKKRRLFSDKFERFSDSEADENAETGIEKRKGTNNSKRLSAESAQIYVNIENERKKVQEASGTKSMVRDKKKAKNGTDPDIVKNVHVEKVFEYSQNANFSYRRNAAEVVSKTNKFSNIFDKTRDKCQKNNYSDFEDLSSDNEYLMKAKRNKTYKKKRASRKRRNVKELLIHGDSLIDERIRSVAPTHSPHIHDDEKMFHLDLDKNFNDLPKVTEQALTMIPPDDPGTSVNLNAAEQMLAPNFNNNPVEQEESLGNITIRHGYGTRAKITTTLNNKTDAIKDTTKTPEKSKKTSADIPNENVKKSKQNRKKNTTMINKLKSLVSEPEPCDIESSLPSLVIENENEMNKGESFNDMDVSKMKAVAGDLTNTTNDLTHVDLEDIQVEAEYNEKSTNCEIAQTKTHFKEFYDQLNEYLGNIQTEAEHNEKSTSYDNCVIDNSPEINRQRASRGVLNEVSNAGQGDHNWGMSTIQDNNKNTTRNKHDSQKKVTGKEMRYNILLPHVDAVVLVKSNENYVKAYEEMQYDTYSSRGDATAKVRQMSNNRNVAPNLQTHETTSIGSDSEHSAITIQNNHSSHPSLSSSRITLNDMFDIQKSLPIDKYRSQDLVETNLNVLERISEELTHTSEHSTPKTNLSMDCRKYLEKHISPLRFPQDVVPSKAPQSGYRLIEDSRNNFSKVDLRMEQLNKPRQPAEKLVTRIPTASARSSCCSRTSLITQHLESVAPPEPVKSPIPKRKPVRSEAEKKYRDLNCTIRTSLDMWLSSLSTMAQQLARYKGAIEELKGELSNDCCVKHNRQQ